MGDELPGPREQGDWLAWMGSAGLPQSASTNPSAHPRERYWTRRAEHGRLDDVSIARASMNRGWTAFGKGLARTLITLLVVLIAFERPLDAAAQAAAQEVEAGNSSPLLKFIAAFDVIDDAFDHQTGNVPHERSQIVVQLALPEPALTNIAIVVAALVEHPEHFADALLSRASLPLERPPRA